MSEKLAWFRLTHENKKHKVEVDRNVSLEDMIHIMACLSINLKEQGVNPTAVVKKALYYNSEGFVQNGRNHD